VSFTTPGGTSAVDRLRVLLVSASADATEALLRALQRGDWMVSAERIEGMDEVRGALALGGWDAVIVGDSPAAGRANALAAVRAHDPELTVIVVVDVASEQEALAALRAGASDCVTMRELWRLAPALRRELTAARERRGRAEAERENRAKDEFLAMLSHELRTPQTALLACTRLLRRSDASEAVRVRTLEVMEHALRAQRDLVGDLLDVSRIAAGQLQLERELVSLTAVAVAAVDLVTPQAREKSVVITLHAADAGHVFVDSRRLQQVIANLVANAVKFTPAGGRVSVVLERTGDEIVLQVTDSGAGIEPSLLPHIFDRFRQGRTGKRQGGLGLGLAIVRQLVELHGGSVRAENASPEGGARFTVVLPAPRRA
jgi:signal transduction histidine kinase